LATLEEFPYQHSGARLHESDPSLKEGANIAYREPELERDPILPAVPRAPPRPHVVQAPSPDIVIENGVIKRVIDVGTDQPTAMTRNDIKRARQAGGGR